ncbi:MAG: hypothetical protein ACRCWG_07195 [Sarcina sp.]
MERLLKEYRQLSVEILEELDKDGFPKLEELLQMKEDIQIEVMKFDADKVKKVLYELDIINLDKEIVEKISCKKDEVKSKINEVKARKATNNAYANAGNRVQFVNSKI